MRRTIATKIITLLGLISLVCPASAGNLSELEIFERCFKRIVRDIPESNDALWVKVQKGQLKGADACMQLFDKAKLGTNGRIANVNDAQARAILRTFNDFHGSWFQQRISENGQAQGIRTFGLINDLEEPQLFLTRALLAGKAYRSVVTDKVSLHGMRVRPADRKNASIFRAQRLISYPGGLTEFDSVDDLRIAYRVGRETQFKVVPDSRIITVGELVGVKEMPVYTLPSIAPISVRNVAGSPDLSAAAVAEAASKVALNENFGGGIVGSPSFIMTNSNLPPGTKATAPADENYMINRVLASRVYEDLLCHQLPTLTEADVKSMLEPKSPHAFHHQQTCMVCHAQIDPFASVYRNFYMGLSAARLQVDGSQYLGLSTYAITRFPTTTGAKAYAETAPVGYVRYRPFRSTKVSTTKVSSLAEIGRTLSASKDLYECAAKRYYQFFTGIDVPLHTLPASAGSDANAAAKLALDRKHQNFVLKLAKDLQANQNLRALVKSIVSSAQFKSRDFQSAVEAK